MKPSDRRHAVEAETEHVDFQNMLRSFSLRFVFTLPHNNSPFLIKITVCVFFLHHLGFLVVSFFGRLDVLGAAAWASSSSLLWKVLMRIACSGAASFLYLQQHL